MPRKTANEVIANEMIEKHNGYRLTRWNGVTVKVQLMGLEMKLTLKFSLECRQTGFELMAFEVKEVSEWTGRCKERLDLFAVERDRAEIFAPQLF